MEQDAQEEVSYVHFFIILIKRKILNFELNNKVLMLDAEIK